MAWLTNRLAGFDTPLEKGHIVLACTFTRLVDLKGGDQFLADYGRLGLLPLNFK